jgi:hypothetical protein
MGVHVGEAVSVQVDVAVAEGVDVQVGVAERVGVDVGSKRNPKLLTISGGTKPVAAGAVVA